MPAEEINRTLDARDFWIQSRGAVVFDVRSPSEFQQGHIPDAVSLPLFDDTERAQVGTVYKNSGRVDAVIRGLNLVGPKMAELALAARSHVCSNNKPAFVHCWRGGMRSQSVQWLLGTVDLSPVILEGGYKAFRQLVHDEFAAPWQLRVVSGLTGVGKTRVLEALKQHGEAVVDLECLANHRGSAFGAIGQAPQPTTEQFENDLFEQLDKQRNANHIWVEDEGNRLGTVVVPPDFVIQLRHAPGIFLKTSAESRLEHLIEDYGAFEPERLKESIRAIRKRLGFDVAKDIELSIDAGEIQSAIERVLEYYDRTYLHAAAKIPRPPMPELDISSLSDSEIVDALKHMA